MEEPDEEWDTTSQRSSEPNGSKVCWVLNRGLRLGKQILIASFVASSASVVLPPLVVVLAIGLAVSVPYGFFLASHACTEKLISKLLPWPTPPAGIFDSTIEEEKGERIEREEVCFHGDIDVEKEEQEFHDETTKGIQMRIDLVDVENMNNDEEKDVMSRNDYGQGGVKENEPELSQDSFEVIQENASKEDNSDYVNEEEKASPEKHANVKFGAKRDDGMEGQLIRESEGEQPMIGGHGVIITIEGLDKIGNDIEEFKTPFEVTSVAVEDFEDRTVEGDIEEAELKRETKGLLEKIRDEVRNDSGGDCVKGIQGGTNESDQKISPVVENMETAWEDNHSCGIGGIERDVRKEEDAKVCDEMLQSRHAENTDIVYNEVESDEPKGGMLKGKEVGNPNASQKPMDEQSELLDGRSVLYETIPAEPEGSLLIEEKDYNISLAADSAEVTSERTDMHTIVKEEPKPQLDGPTIQLEDAREFSDESEFDLFDEKGIDPKGYIYTIDLHEESSNAMVDGHTDTMELVSSVEDKLKPSECSSGKDIMSPSHEVVFNDENIWKQIHAIRKIVGYQGTPQASCTDELKALYIFTGVEPPTFLKENFCDPAEINEKLHFLMSIVGIKSNVA